MWKIILNKERNKAGKYQIFQNIGSHLRYLSGIWTIQFTVPSVLFRPPDFLLREQCHLCSKLLCN